MAKTEYEDDIEIVHRPRPQFRVDNFDRLMGQLHGLPDVTSTRETTKSVVPPLGVGTSTYIVQTYRQKEVGDTIFLQHVSADGTTRLVIPPEIADIISRQRDSLTDKVRSKVAKATAQARKEAGILPGFMKNRKAKK